MHPNDLRRAVPLWLLDEVRKRFLGPFSLVLAGRYGVEQNTTAITINP